MKNKLKFNNMIKFLYVGSAAASSYFMIESTIGVINHEPHVSTLQNLISNPSILIAAQVGLTVSSIACYGYVASRIFKKSSSEEETLNTKLKMK